MITAVESDIADNPFSDEEKALAEAMSRGTIVNEDNFSTFNKNGKAPQHIGLFAFAYPALTSYNNKTDYTYADVVADANSDITTYINNGSLSIKNAEVGSGDKFTLNPDKTYYWTTSSHKLTFYGIYPAADEFGADGTSEYYAINKSDSKLFVDLTVDPNNADQRDVLVAQKTCAGDGSSTGYTAELAMKHVLTAVTVSLDASLQEQWVLNKCTFSGINVKGKYDVVEDSWALDANTDARSVSVEGSSDLTKLSSADNTMFMMLPQTLPAGSYLEVVLADKNNASLTETYRVDLKDAGGNAFTWPQGKTVNYVISIDNTLTNYVIETDLDQMNFSWNGTPAGDGDKYYETIYKTDSNGEYILDEKGNKKTESVLRLNDLGCVRVRSYKEVTTEGSNGTSNTTYEELPWDSSIAETNIITTGLPTSENATAIASTDVDAKDYINTMARDYTTKFKVNVTSQGQKVETIASNDVKTVEARADIVFGTESNPVDLSLYKQQYSSTTARSDGKKQAVPIAYGSGVRRASNCYIVNYPGYYKIPVSYGCTITSTDENIDHESYQNYGAYSLGTSGTGALSTMTNYKGDNIIAGWITYWKTPASDYFHMPGYNGGTWQGRLTNYPPIQDSFVLWQDHKGLVKIINDHKTVKTLYNNDSANSIYYVWFYIDPANFHPGNAVIKVINGESLVLWSYHIWVTSKTVKENTFEADINIKGSIDNNRATYLDVPLGYVQHEYKKYPGCDAVLTLHQKNSSGAYTGKTAEVKLVQKPHECHPQSCCYYQWGRKDPFPGAIIYETGHMNFDDSYAVGTENVVTYDENGSVVNMSTKSCYGSEIKDGIQNPFTFFTSASYNSSETSKGTSGRFPDYNYWDLWGCTYADNGTSDPAIYQLPGTAFGSSSRKTVYDPCPAGFKVPPILGFPAFTSDGVNHTSVYNPMVRSTENESLIYGSLINTPYTTHDDFVNNGYFEFYTNRMGSDGSKGGTTYKIFAMGHREPGGGFTGLGTQCFYWACTNWASTPKGIYNHRAYYTQIGYGGGGSNFIPVCGNTETAYGNPIMPMKDTAYPIN
jgi:hypothetical protein